MSADTPAIYPLIPTVTSVLITTTNVCLWAGIHQLILANNICADEPGIHQLIPSAPYQPVLCTVCSMHADKC